MTKVPGIGVASIHCLSAFRTCKAWIPGSCHRMVKHYMVMLSSSYNTAQILVTSKLRGRIGHRASMGSGEYILCVCADTNNAVINGASLWRIVKDAHNRSSLLGLGRILFFR